jgi:hypothetical protein
LIVLGRKRIECRSWTTSHRGRLLIHAALRDERASNNVACVAADAEHPALAARGAIIGFTILTDCRKATQQDKALALCEIPFGWFAWVFDAPHAFIEGIPFRGKLGLFEVDQPIALPPSAAASNRTQA